MRREAGTNPGPTVLDDVVERACRERPDDCQGRAGRGAVESQVEAKATQLLANERIASKQVLESIAALANGLAKLPGRKTLVLITEGFFVENAVSDIQVVVGRAARASVRIYALDSRGLNRGSASSDILTGANPSQPEMSAPSLGDLGSDAPNSLAVDTGGYVIRNENDFGKAFTEIDRDTSSYYIVGFRTARPPDGKFHNLTVRVKRRRRDGALAERLPRFGRCPRCTDARRRRPPRRTPLRQGRLGRPCRRSRRSFLRRRRLLPLLPAAGRRRRPLPPRQPPPATTEPARRSSGSQERRGNRDDWRRRRVAKAWSTALPPELRKQAAARLGSLPAWRRRRRRATCCATVAEQPAAPPWTQYVLGWSYLALGEPGPAAANWEKVRAAVPQFEPVYFDLADAYQRDGEYSKAIASLRDAEQRWPNDVEVYSALGVLQLARGAVDEAIATFTKGVGVAPKDANVCYNLAKTYEVRYVRSERLRKVGPGSGAEPRRSRIARRRSRITREWWRSAARWWSRRRKGSRDSGSDGESPNRQ